MNSMKWIYECEEVYYYSLLQALLLDFQTLLRIVVTIAQPEVTRYITYFKLKSLLLQRVDLDGATFNAAIWLCLWLSAVFTSGLITLHYIAAYFSISYYSEESQEPQIVFSTSVLPKDSNFSPHFFTDTEVKTE